MITDVERRWDAFALRLRAVALENELWVAGTPSAVTRWVCLPRVVDTPDVGLASLIAELEHNLRQVRS